MPGDRRELRTDFIAHDVNTARTIKDIGDKAERAGDKLDGMAKDARGLDTQLGETQGRIRLLAQEIDRTGDKSLIKKWRAEQRELKQLMAVKNWLPGEQEGEDAGEHVGKGFRTSFFARISTSGVQAGALLTRSLGSSFGGLPVEAQALIGAGLVSAVAVAAPAVTAVVAGAITAGVGSGALAGGVLLAARDHRVQEAGADLGRELMKGLEDASGVLVGPVLKSIGILRDGVRDIQPDLTKAFSTVAPYVDDLTRGVVALVKNAMPGFNRLLERSGPLLDLLGDELGDVGDALSGFFDDISRNTKGAEAGLKLVLDGLERLITVTGKVVEYGTKGFELFGQGLAIVTGDIPGFVNSLRDQEVQTEAVRSSFERLSDSQQIESRALSSAGAAAQDHNERVKILGLSLAGAAEEAGGLAQALDLLSGGSLNARAAEREYQAAIDAVTDSVKENGKTLNISTAEGRANQGVLDGLARAAIQNADAVYKQTAATEDVTTAQEEASGVLAKGREQLIKSARQMGLNKQAATEYADKILGTPKSWSTKFSAETAAAGRAVDDLARKVRNLPSKKTISIAMKLTGNTNVSATIAALGKNQRDGGINFARSGRMSPQLLTSETVIAGERETGGEVFIPRIPGAGGVERQRDLVEVAAGWAGMRGGGRGADEAALYRAFVRALRELPVFRLPNAGLTADLYARGG